MSMVTSSNAKIDASARVDAGASIGDGCVVKAGAYVCNGVTLASGVYIGPNVAFVETLQSEKSDTRVECDAWIGANATIYPGVSIAAKAVVRPGSVVTRSVPPNAIVEGNPATIVGYVDVGKPQASTIQQPHSQDLPSIEATPVKGVTIHHLPIIPDLRGTLSVGEFQRQIPFTPKRFFIVYGVPSREVRGEHAHLKCHQFLVCLHGSCSVVADDGHRKVEIPLAAPNLGLYLPPMTWGIQYKYSPDAMLLVFASDYYDPSDYIRDYSDFTQLIGHSDARS